MRALIGVTRSLSKIYDKALQATGLFLYPLITSEYQRFSDAFRGYRKRTVAWNRLIAYFIVNVLAEYVHCKLSMNFTWVTFPKYLTYPSIFSVRNTSFRNAQQIPIRILKTVQKHNSPTRLSSIFVMQS